jgi:hypothetical protein
VVQKVFSFCIQTGQKKNHCFVNVVAISILQDAWSWHFVRYASFAVLTSKCQALVLQGIVGWIPSTRSKKCIFLVQAAFCFVLLYTLLDSDGLCQTRWNTGPLFGLFLKVMALYFTMSDIVDTQIVVDITVYSVQCRLICKSNHFSFFSTRWYLLSFE